MSRALEPEHRHHNLDRLLQRDGLPCGERHRALENTRAVHALAQHLYQVHPTQTVDSEVARPVKHYQPVFNRRLRRQNELCAIRWDPNQHTETPPRVVPAGDLPPRELGELFGVFRSRRRAREVLRNLAGEHRLCLQRLRLESGRGPCFGYQLGRCRGVCAGREAEAKHRLRLRLLRALSALRLAVWPCGRHIGIREHCPDNGRSEVGLVDHWCHLGTATNGIEWAELLSAPQAVGFELDSYRLLRRYLEQHSETEVIRAP